MSESLIRKYKVNGDIDTYNVCVFTHLTTIEGIDSNFYRAVAYSLENGEVQTLINKYEQEQLSIKRGIDG